MIRRSLTILSAGVIAATMFAGTAGAVDPPPAATGAVSCRLVGRVTFSTPLATGGTTATTAKFVGKANGCTGSDGGAAVKFGVVTASADLATNDCAALAVPGAITLNGTATWKTTALAIIQDTTFSLGTFTLDATSTIRPLLTASGTASAGSFSGQSVASTLSVSQSNAAIANQCGAGRLRGLTVRASQSRILIGTLPV